MSSDYFKKLDTEAQVRYRAKLSFRGEELPDALDDDVVRFAFTSGPRNLPPVTVADIYLYLVEGVCFYTNEQFKSYKLEDAYNAFICGKVKQVKSFKAGAHGDGVVVIAATVEASQTLSKSYKAWCIVKEDGTIESAHCTCMAGLGECCTHVAALLFRVEATAQYGLNDPSPTDVACKWIEASKGSTAAPVSEIEFFKPKIGRAPPQVSEAPDYSVPVLTDEQVSRFLHQVKEIAPNTLILTSISDSEDTDSAPETAALEPVRVGRCKQLSAKPPLAEIYQDLDIDEGKKVELTAACCSEIEEATRGQARSPRWLQERRGRITASVMHRVAACSTGAAGLVAEIMGYVKTPQVSNLRWGSETEKKAVQAFIETESQKHVDFSLRDCGLFIARSMPFIGASPDALVSCSCCPKSVLEVKCPATMKDASLTKGLTKLAYLNEDLQLKHNHAYYTQIQAQMALTGLCQAYFVVFTGSSLTKEIISFDETFWAATKLKAANFFFTYIFPELQSMHIFSQIERAKKTCHCRGTKLGHIVECSLCEATFHLKCVKLRRTPRQWICTACQHNG
ncbi:uncharacterized protein LOC144106157 isoform X1 [Amblyomma americanum]